jgi:cell division protein FtsB
MPFSRSPSNESLRRWIIGGVLCVVFVWIGFFDSHSLLRRYQWHQEQEQLVEENEELRREIDQLRNRLDRPLTDSLVERIAREEYGMKRPDETVYRLKREN